MDTGKPSRLLPCERAVDECVCGTPPSRGCMSEGGLNVEIRSWLPPNTSGVGTYVCVCNFSRPWLCKEGGGLNMGKCSRFLPLGEEETSVYVERPLPVAVRQEGGDCGKRFVAFPTEGERDICLCVTDLVRTCVPRCVCVLIVGSVRGSPSERERGRMCVLNALFRGYILQGGMNVEKRSRLTPRRWEGANGCVTSTVHDCALGCVNVWVWESVHFSLRGGGKRRVCV